MNPGVPAGVNAESPEPWALGAVESVEIYKMDMGSLGTKLILIALATVVTMVVVYALSGRKRRVAEPMNELTYAPGYAPGSAADPARDAFAAAGEERPTEDQIARARLGGSRGAPELGAAPLVGQAREQTPRNIDDGHVA